MSQINRRAASWLSMSQKAGKLASGDTAAENALRSGEARLIIVSEEASDNTKKKFRNKSFFYKTPILVGFTREELERSIGKRVTTIAVLDEGFAKELKKELADLLEVDYVQSETL